jgi:hypothetical protein
MKTRFLLVLTTLIGVLDAYPLRGAEPATVPPRILFLHLRVANGVFTVLSATNAPGILKARRDVAPARAYRIALEDAAGQVRWIQRLADPTVQRFEYEDPDQPGKLRVKEVRLPEAEFLVRVPDLPGRRRLAVYRTALPDAALSSVRAKETLVTRIELPDGGAQ